MSSSSLRRLNIQTKQKAQNECSIISKSYAIERVLIQEKKRTYKMLKENKHDIHTKSS